MGCSILHVDNVLKLVNITECAAIACHQWAGFGKEKEADQAAVQIIREKLNQLDIKGNVVIGEGERDEAPMLYIGEKIGLGWHDLHDQKQGEYEEIDIALDPLEGTTICANFAPGALAVIAFAKKGDLLHAPDVYMDKIVVGSGLPNDIISLDNTPKQNLIEIARARKCTVSDMVVTILKRDRHLELIENVREAGARIQLITDGDIAAAIVTNQNPHYVYMGIGGAPEGVLAATAIKSFAGQMCGRLIFKNDEQRNRALKMGISNLEQELRVKHMVKGDAVFVATGVTDGNLLAGVRFNKNKVTLSTMVTHSSNHSYRIINSELNNSNKITNNI